MTDTPTAAPQPAEGVPPQPTGPTLRVMGQYIKDLSFENPATSAPNTQISTDLNVDVSAAPKDNEQGVFEVSLKIGATAKAGETTLFIIELDYAATVQLISLNEQDVVPMLLIEVPRLLFPFARRTIGEITRDGGYPPLLVDPIDFVALYEAQRAAPPQGEQWNSAPAT